MASEEGSQFATRETGCEKGCGANTGGSFTATWLMKPLS